jgi:GABA permease
VVANLTVCGDQLAAAVKERLRDGPCSFTVIVPASADPHTMTWTESDVLWAARDRLDRALRVFRALGADATGDVGDWTPLLAVEDALRAGRFDEIIVSTLAPGLSHWIRLDLPHRVARRFGLPMSHVVSPPDAAATAAVRSPSLVRVSG